MALLVLALALFVGLSPVLAELAGHVRAEPSALYVLGCAAILGVALVDANRRGWREAPSILRAAPWLAAAVALEVLAFAAGIERFARPAFALALVGWLRAAGWAPLPVAALAFWLVPLPKLFAEFAEVGFHQLWQALASAVSEPIEANLQLGHWDSGLRLAALGSAAGWWHAFRSGRSPWRGALRIGAVGFASQAAALAVAIAIAAAGAPRAARAFLTHGVWIVATALLLGWLAPRRSPGAVRVA
jgi:hypothetical protein